LDAGVVHSHGYRTDVVAALSGAVPGARLVSTAHGYTGGGRKNRLYERLQAAAWRRFGAVIAVSEPLVQELHRRGLDPRRVRLIPNAWRGDARSVDRPEARRRLGIESDARVVGWVGRITQEKGPDVALDAFARLAAREGAPAQLHFVGEGRLRPELESRAAALGLAERVHWHGAVAGAARLFPAFDVLLLSSHTEGTPMVLFEAMAASVPIVATSVGGVPDVLGPGGGWLVPPRSPDALAAALEEALTSPVEAHSRVARATDRLNAKYAVGPWVDAHLALYRELAES
jgi:glycosyltransferase involved in cell wall biosynthesis